ncbi:MAG TPA: pepsin/retropepsin-like aspartic protease family protein [Terracidiphilus sp.]|nr:pepsin/retropepsin-like aspartic protease family protein [Terracidiphilus sp.]
MFDSNQAFALRDAVKLSHLPVFYRGAVEESQNRVAEAKKDLDRAIAADPRANEAFEACEMLANMNFRQGRFREALAEAEAAHAVKPESADLNNMLPLLRGLAESPDMSIAQRRSSRFEMKADSDGSRGLPVLINGKEVRYGFDTGAALSVMGESDAKLLGLTVKHVETKLNEASGTAIPGFNIAVAEDLVIAGLHLKNVPFFVLQDTGEPFVHVPVGRRGLIGLPVLLAMQTVRWEPSSGWFAFGKAAEMKNHEAQNLLFHGATAIVQVHVKDKALIFSLDTGATDTDLNEGFAKALPAIVEAGQKENRAITGLGGSNQYDSVLLGPVEFDVGGSKVTLKAPHVFPKHSLGNFDGNLGNDILHQAKAVALDFEAMELRLE